MKKLSKILVLLLTFSLLLGALAVFASADVSKTDVAKIGDKGYATFELAMEDAMKTPDSTITLLSDASVSDCLFTVTANVTVDLNWHTLTLTNPSNTAAHFSLTEGDVNVKFVNGNIVYSAAPLFYLSGDKTVLNLANVHISQGTQLNNAYALRAVSTTANVPTINITNSVIQAARVLNIHSCYLNVNATDSVLQSTNSSNVIRISTHRFLDGELNFTNCHMWTGAGTSARLIEMESSRMANFGSNVSPEATHGLAGSAENLNYEYELVDGTTYKITKIDNAVFNFYNCSFYAKGGVTIGPAIYEMHFYGGYYGNTSANSLLSNTSGIARQLLGRVYFHTYTDEAGNVYYPTFNKDPSASTHIVMSDLYDFDVTFTYNGTTYGSFTIANKTAKENAAKIVANQNEGAAYGYVFVPAGDTSTPSVADPIALPDAVAMLNGKLYTDINVAAKAAGEDDIVHILADITGATITDSAVFNTNGFAFSNNIIGINLHTEDLVGNLTSVVDAKTTNFEIIDDATGNVIGVGDAENETAFVQAMFYAAAGTTIKLTDDIAISTDNNKLSTNEFTLDLNGKTVYLKADKCLRGLDADGDGVADNASCTPWSTCSTADSLNHVVGTNATFCTSGELNFTLKSSSEGGTIYNVGSSGNQLFWITSACTGGYFNIDGENLTIYTNVLLWMGNSAECPVTIDGGSYINHNHNASSALFQLDNNNFTSNVVVNDAFIDASSYNLTYFAQTEAAATDATKSQNLTFNNCTIVSAANKNIIFSEASTTSNDVTTYYYTSNCNLTFNNTSIFGVALNNVSYNDKSVNITVKGNCFFSHEPTATNITYVDCDLKALSGKFMLPVTSTFGFATKDNAYDPVNTHTAEFLASVTKTTEYEYAYGTQYSTVDWTLDDATVKTLYYYVPAGGTTVSYNEYTTTANYVESSYAGSTELAENDKTYTAALALTGKRVVEITGIMYNLTLASDISANVAIPAAVWEHLNVIVNGNTYTKADAAEVVIGEDTYYVVSYTGITAIDTVDSLNFAITAGEGVTPYDVNVSVAAYANKLMTEGTDEVQCELGRALIVYALESYKHFKPTGYEDAVETLTAYGAAAKSGATFPAESTEALATYFKGARLRLTSTPGIVFEVAESKYTDGVVATFTYINENLDLVEETVTLNGDKKECVLKMKVYNFDQNVKITVEGDDTTYVYNLDTYLTTLAKTNDAFAQAIHYYVEAAKAYVTPADAE